MSLILRNLRLPLADFTLELDVELRGRVTAIFGTSGAGKTSLLELIAGLRHAKSGFIQGRRKRVARHRAWNTGSYSLRAALATFRRTSRFSRICP